MMSLAFRATSLFFSSSIRLHTMCSRDWSSDVCSSDLQELSREFTFALSHVVQLEGKFPAQFLLESETPAIVGLRRAVVIKIGRASCRETGKRTVVRLRTTR